MSNPSDPEKDAQPPGDAEATEETQESDETAAEAEAQEKDDKPKGSTEVGGDAEPAPSDDSNAANEAEEFKDGPSDPPTEAIDTGEPEPQFDSAEPTVVLPTADFDPNLTQRRYSAPSGYDAKSTEIIRTNAPEPATDIIAAPVPPRDPVAAPPPPPPAGAPRPIGPQAIPPRPDGGRKHRSWGLVAALILVIAALVAVAVFGTIWLTHKASPKVSQEDMVKQTIQDFDTAIQKGDLSQLRGITCGSTRDRYVKYSDKDWAATYPRIAAAKQYPVVASIDQVVVNEQHAEANVTTFMAYAPQTRSTRSFDLQFLDGRWKICEGPVS
jgi:hypothetical protein